jgi:hypothetical protein
MKALSIKQPWAWLIANGYKDIENRNWWTSYRGQLLIHAGKSLDREGEKWIKYKHPEIILPTFAQGINMGGIVGQGDLVDCVTASSSPWFFGEFGFCIKNATPLPFRPLNGQLGFFEVLA